ncbi:hypothetical protein MCOR25_010925 [Pyricularia grisea]|nr:hypothetical protein MCOR25_010925 [Pyricularia grisea]
MQGSMTEAALPPLVQPPAEEVQQAQAIQQPDANGEAHQASGISADEIALYDRQIRLWGMQAQEKIRSANVLLVTVKALANEIAKNLVLAGINSLTIVDHEVVTAVDFGAQFLLSEDEGHLGMNRAEAASVNLRKLNPRVDVIVDKEDIRTRGPNYFQNFSVVIATDLDPDAFNIINLATRIVNKPFYAAGSHGFYGYIFADLIEHVFVIQRDEGNVATKLQPESRTRDVIDVQVKKEGGKSIERVTKRERYSTWTLSDVAPLPEEYRKSPRRLRAVTPVLSCLRALFEFQQEKGRLPALNRREDLERFTTLATERHHKLGLPVSTLKSEVLRSFLQNIGSELAPVTAIIGGQLAQDVINVLGASQAPIQNTLIFDGNTMEANMYPLHPEDDQLGSGQLVFSSPAGVQFAVDSSNAMAAGVVPDPSLMIPQVNMAGPDMAVVPGPDMSLGQ